MIDEWRCAVNTLWTARSRGSEVPDFFLARARDAITEAQRFATAQGSLQRWFNIIAYVHDLMQSRSFRQLQNAWAGEICAIATSTTAFIVVFHEDPFKGTTTT
jgi:hypothetical protein